jgi:hypothetical protein
VVERQPIGVLILGCFELEINRILSTSLKDLNSQISIYGVNRTGTLTQSPEQWAPDYSLRFLRRVIKTRDLGKNFEAYRANPLEFGDISCLLERYSHEIRTWSDQEFVRSLHWESGRVLGNYWIRALVNYNIKRVLFCNTPHNLFDYLGLQVARHLGLSTLVTNELRELPNRLYLTQAIVDLDFSSVEHQETEQVFQSQVSDHDVEEWLGRIRRLTNPCSRASVDGLDDQKARKVYIKGNMQTRLSNYGRITLRLHSPYGLIRKALDKQLLRQSKRELSEITSYNLEALLEEPYVYFPLHQQPEATTCPRAGEFVDQRRIVQTLLDGIPARWKVIVKEHPDQFLKSYPRLRGFYRDLCSDPRVFVAPVDTPSAVLLKSAVAVVTAGSSAARQALSLHKPVLLFGYSPFSAHSYVRRIWTSSDVSRFVQEHEPPVAWDEKEDEEFARKLLRQTFVGCLSSMNGLSPQQWKSQSAPLLGFLQSWVNS